MERENRAPNLVGSAAREDRHLLLSFPFDPLRERFDVQHKQSRPELARFASRLCMYSHKYTARVWINRVRLSVLLVVSSTRKINIPLSPYAPENLASRDGFGSLVPRQPAHLHTQAESGAYLQFPPEFRGGVH